MTFRDVAYKNFKSNIKRYTSYLLCSSFALMAFFIYLNLFYNGSISRVINGNKTIREMIYLALGMIAAFAVLFISYTYTSFIKSRSKELGLYMILGMTSREIRKIVVIENALIGLMSTVIGLVSGTVFARLFFLIVLKILDIEKVKFVLDYRSYLYTAGVFLGIFLVVILTSVIYIERLNIISLLKLNRKIEDSKFKSPLLGLAGLGVTLFSFTSLYSNVKSDTAEKHIALPVIFGFIGIYIAISQFGSLVLSIIKKNKKTYYNNLLAVTSINSRFKSNKRIIFIMTLLTAVTIFFMGPAYTMYSKALESSKEANPYHMSYVEIFDKNKIPLEELYEVLNMGEARLEKHDALEFLRMDFYIIDSYYDKNTSEGFSADVISVSDYNKLSNKNLNVPRGYFVDLMQTPKFYAEKANPIRQIGFKTGEDVESFYYDSTICEMLVGKNHFTCSTIRILNDQDYERLRGTISPEKVGRIHLFDFNNWYQTGKTAEKLDEVLKEYNKNHSKIRIFDDYGAEEYLFAPVSRIQTFRQQKQEGGIFLFVWGFIGLLFFMSSGSVLYFKLHTEIDDVKKRYRKIFNIGIRDREIKRILSKELRLIFFTPPVIGCITGFTMVYVLTANSSIQKDMVVGAAVIILLYFIFQMFYYLITRKKYIDSIIESI